jgi:hypothetical protein
VITKEKTHVLGIKVRVVGGKSGRVAHILSPGEDAAEAAAALGAGVSPVTPNKGIRSQLLAASINGGNRHWTPYQTKADLWIPRGPAAAAAAALAGLGLNKPSSSARKATRYGESGQKKMRRAVAEGLERAESDLKKEPL